MINISKWKKPKLIEGTLKWLVSINPNLDEEASRLWVCCTSSKSGCIFSRTGYKVIFSPLSFSINTHYRWINVTISILKYANHYSHHPKNQWQNLKYFQHPCYSLSTAPRPFCTVKYAVTFWIMHHLLCKKVFS